MCTRISIGAVVFLSRYVSPSPLHRTEQINRQTRTRRTGQTIHLTFGTAGKGKKKNGTTVFKAAAHFIHAVPSVHFEFCSLLILVHVFTQCALHTCHLRLMLKVDINRLAVMVAANKAELANS